MEQMFCMVKCGDVSGDGSLLPLPLLLSKRALVLYGRRRVDDDDMCFKINISKKTPVVARACHTKKNENLEYYSAGRKTTRGVELPGRVVVCEPELYES